MSKSRIIVIGSSNTDMVIQTNRFPKPGETVLGGEFFMNQGGKGANQAVAAARLGGNVTFVSSVGNDVFGKATLQGLSKEGIDVSYVLINEDKPTGVATITVDKSGENSIVVAPGANNELLINKISDIEGLFNDNVIVLMQLEIPIETVRKVTKIAKEKGAKVVLNPAPAQQLDQDILTDLYALTPNEEEAFLLSGIEIVDIDSAKVAAKILVDKGVENVVITMGAKGALALFEDNYSFVKAQQVTAVDSTAAGDVFNGAFVVALSEGMTTLDTLEFASVASGISVTRLGAQSSSPYRNELESYYENSQNQL